MTDRPGGENRDDRDNREERDPAAEQQGPVVRDKRRIDPVTGALREPAGPAPAPPAPGCRTQACRTHRQTVSAATSSTS